MVTHFPYWDVAWLVAKMFTRGSVVWVIKALLVFLPLVRPSTELKDEILVGGRVLAFIGATIIEIGNVLLMVEVCSCRAWTYA